MSVLLRRLVALVLLLLAAGGCESTDRTLDAWTFAIGDGPRTTVALPAHLDALLPRARTTYALRTRVDLPPGERARDHVLVVPRLLAHATLKVNGVQAVPLEPHDPRGYRTEAGHLWAIPAAAGAEGSLELELDVSHTWTQSGWVDPAPRLSSEPWGGTRLALLRAFNGVTAYFALGLATFSAYLYLGVYLTDRRRTAHGWFALTGLSGALYPLFDTGLVQRFLGPWEVTMAGLAVSTAVITNMQFTRAYFGLPAPSRAWWVACGATCIICVESTGYFTGTRPAGIAAVLLVVPAILTQVFLLVRLLKLRPPAVDAAVVLVGWPLMAVLGTPDFAAWLGLGEWAGGLRGASMGIAVIGLLQTVALSRAHTRTLREADDLARERGERLKHVEHLNEELRRQIVGRSRQLADALATLGGESGELVLQPGAVVQERYAVVRVLGAGAGGTVYLVDRIADRIQFALKVVRSGGDMHALARLAREAQLAAEVQNDHVVKIVDVDVASSGFLYVVMEYVPGVTLRDERPRYGDLAWALPVLQQLAEGLSVVHERGIVHRDLKPANILLVASENGSVRVKIADFGIARGADRAWSSHPPPSHDSPPTETMRPITDPRLTMTGMLMGTPLYMAPETIDGAREASPAVDIFAFGVVAYEVLSKKLPFRESPALAQLDGMSVAPPRPLGDINDEVPAAVAAIVDRCLAFDPTERPTASELTAALRGVDATDDARTG